MKLGVYKRQGMLDDDPTTYTRYALYDFETEEWGEHSSGAYVKRVSENPTPEEMKAKIEVETNGRANIVRTPQWVAAQEGEVTINTDPVITVSEGKQKREEMGGPLITTIELQYQENQGVRVISNDEELTAEQKESLEERGYDIISESEWDGIDFTEEFDFEFYTGTENES